MNVADSTMLAELLAQQGYATATDSTEADLVVVNTCSVRDRAEQRAKARIAEFAARKRKNGSNQGIWVIGCMAQRFGERLKTEIPGVDRVIGATEVETLGEHIGRYLAATAESPVESPRVEVSSFVPIIRGCDNFCTYCIVPHVRGREHSVPAERLVAGVRDLVGRGTREITLLGQNVNSYRDPDAGLDLPGLLRRLQDIEGLERIRFTTSHPKDCSRELIQTMAELPKVCSHIHLPAQSGSSRVLQRMNRRYTRQDYLRRIETIRTAMPEADITTDVMVGFPGEEKQDYRDTLSLMEEARFTAAFMFAYSPRPGTAAEKMADTVPTEISQQRLAQMIELQTGITKQHYADMVDRTAELLITERQAKHERRWMGQNYGAKRALVACDNDVTGMILKVRVVDTTGMTLLCERMA